MDKNAPIGIFDSGLGGLTVARAVMDVLPQENVLYVGDTLNTPYGDKPLSQVRKYALDIMDSLIERGVKMLVIACNTASAAVLADARERYTKKLGIPVVEVIHPASSTALEVTRNKKIGIIGTRATVTSGAYQDTLSIVPGVQVYAQACPKFVPLVEAGVTTGKDVFDACHEYLTPLKDAGVDTLVLGCTHYPMLAGAISYEMGESVALVACSDATARRAYSVLREQDLLNESTDPGALCIEATGQSDLFMDLAKRIMGHDRAEVTHR